MSEIKNYYYYYYTCFLDASKTFDRINHWTMFKRLIFKRCNVPVLLIRLLCFGILLNNYVDYGARRCPLFSQYQMVFPKGEYYLLNCSLFIWTICLSNHVFFYEEDLCLMAPCPIALQELLHICHNYSISVDVNFNALKCFCIAFTPKPFKLSLLQVVINTAHIPYTDSIKYLEFILQAVIKTTMI